MLSFTQDQLYAWMTQFLWPFMRIIALVGTAPLLGETPIPAQAKIGLAVVLTFALAPTLAPMPAIAPGSLEGIMLGAQQVFIGIALGFTMKLVFIAAQTAGEFVGLQMGLSFASFFDRLSGANTAVLSSIFNAIAMLLFLALDGHLLMIQAVVHTFETLPIAQGTLNPNGMKMLAGLGTEIFRSGLLLALPLITALLTINLALGILNRASPQLSVFAVGFPISMTAGLILLALVLPEMPPFMEELFANGLGSMSRVIEALAGR
jgi:flagellar biosynthetic protein FliR